MTDIETITTRIESLERLIRHQTELIESLTRPAIKHTTQSKEKITSKYRGVSYNQRAGKWTSQFKGKYLGRFDSEEEARLQWEKSFSASLSTSELKEEIRKGTFHFLYTDMEPINDEFVKKTKKSELDINEILK